MLGTELSFSLTVPGVDGQDLDFGDSRASTEADFWTRPVPEVGLCGDPEEET